MRTKLIKLSVILCCYITSSCNSSPKTSSSQAPAANAAANTGSAATASNATSTDGGLGGLSSLLQGLGASSSGGSGSGGGSGGSSSEASSPNAISWSTRFGEPFLSFQLFGPKQNYLNQNSISSNAATSSDTYHCPGDSFLVGFRGIYSTTAGDRQMQAYCQFFEDGNGSPIKKSNCELAPGLTAGVDAKNDFLCPNGKFLAGLATTWDESKSDRNYSFECCTASTQSSTKLAFLTSTDSTTSQVVTTCENLLYASGNTLQANAAHGTLDLHCAGSSPNYSTGQMDPMPSVMQSITTSYMSHTSAEGEAQNDRAWSFQCCAMGVP